ncbi:MAG TPA: PH domain-containing protein [Candidatus Udaeobacter sp.]|nr:PH domain-containing protein [Candidatus Udaeobacter sp.]
MSLRSLIKQKSYEKVMFTARRHPITFVPYVIFFLLLLIVPFGLYWLLNNSSLSVYLITPTGRTLGILAASVYFLSIFLFFYTNFVTFHLDVWIVTNDRLLDMEQKSLFDRVISELDLYQIQDATSEISGFFPSIFNYGNISLQTAGAIDRFTFKNVANPNKLRELILDLSAEDKKYHEKP